LWKSLPHWERVSDHTGADTAAAAMDWPELQQRVLKRQAKLASFPKPFSAFGRGLGSSGYAMARILYHAEFAGCPPPAVLNRLEKATAALVDRAADPTQPSRRRVAGVSASLQHSRPADGGFGVLALREHIHARHALWAVKFVMARAAGEQTPWVLLAQQQLCHALDREAHPLELLGLKPGQLTSDILPPPMRRMIQGLHRLPPLRLLADPATQLTQPAVGYWCAAAPLWNIPLLDLRLVGPGNPVVPMAERVACRAVQMHGIVTPQSATHPERGARIPLCGC